MIKWADSISTGNEVVMCSGGSTLRAISDTANDGSIGLEREAHQTALRPLSSRAALLPVCVDGREAASKSVKDSVSSRRSSRLQTRCRRDRLHHKEMNTFNATSFRDFMVNNGRDRSILHAYCTRKQDDYMHMNDRI